ncbi:MAG: ribonuclease P protein component 1 [Desulfurococcales archaeon]|nr:ribonuclease P protein component 1 [Desulfurococcales archaeon]
MRRTPSNLLRHELVGLDVRVIDHPSRSLIGASGKVIYETKKTLHVADLSGKVRIIPKEHGKFLFKLGSKTTVRVNGSRLIGRPEERLKRVRRN